MTGTYHGANGALVNWITLAAERPRP